MESNSEPFIRNPKLMSRTPTLQAMSNEMLYNKENTLKTEKNDYDYIPIVSIVDARVAYKPN